MPVFEDLPFDEQLVRIGQTASAGTDVTALIAAAASLPDVDPLCRLFDALAEHGWTDARLVVALSSAFSALGDAALQRLLGSELREPSALSARLTLARDALHAWPLERASGLAVLYRWISRLDPDAKATLTETSRARIDDDPRWGFFLDGAALGARSTDPTTKEETRRTVRGVLDALARAPKSVSQANAEALLARRVYADAGHFLFELMQNADDAGASRWEVEIEPERTVVSHDGAPFSFLDVVGVLSIGLTTKRADQIGMFGVGFKSVYEITERPRIHSGAFDFEIAHVSIPRVLGVRPAAARDQTVLLLPHRAGVSATRLAARARAIPAEVLMTLPHLTELTVRSPDRPPARVSSERRGSTVILHRGAEQVAYRTAQRSVEGTRQGAVRVLAAVRLDRDGEPTPIEGPTLYAFLPTGERTGLTAIVHARFDVTVDRERLDPGSDTNRTLLTQAGEVLAEVLRELSAEGKRVLRVVPTEESLSPLVAPLAASLRDALRDVACLPGMSGERLTPATARLLEEPLATALAGVDLGPQSGPAEHAVELAEPREWEAARFLGARPFSSMDLVDLLEARLSSGHNAPPWLGPPVLAAVGEAPIADARLRALPILVDGAGRLATAEAARVAEPPWVALYAGLRPLVRRATITGSALEGRMAVEAFDPADVIEDLETFPQLVEREHELFVALDSADDAVLAALRPVPLFRTASGERRSVEAGLVRLHPALEPLRDLIVRSLLDPGLEADHPGLVARAVPVLALGELIVAWEAAPPDEPLLDTIASILDREVESLSGASIRRLAALPLFRDQDGRPRPLLGEGRAQIATDPKLPALLAELPWLADPERPFVRAARPAPMGPSEVALAIAASSSAVPIRFELLEWLGAHRGDLTARALEALSESARFPDVTGAPRRIRELRAETSSPAIEAFYRATQQRFVIHPRALLALRSLHLELAVTGDEGSRVAADLVALAPEVELEAGVLGALLSEIAPSLRPEDARRLLEQPRFFDETGRARALASLASPRPDRAHPAGRYRTMLRSGPYPLLDADLEAALAPLLERWGPARPGVQDLVRIGSQLGEPDALLSAVLEHPEALDADTRSTLATLPLFASRSGRRHPASSLADPSALRRHLGAETLGELGLDDALTDDEAARAIGTLGLATRPLADLLASDVLPRIEAGARLDAQAPPFDRAAALVALLSLSVESGLDVARFPLAIDRLGRVVRGPLYAASDASRALAARLSFGPRLADPEWGAHPAAARLLEPLSARAIANALLEACPEERAREGHPVLSDPTLLYEWMRADAEALGADDAARGALASACVIPSQQGTLRAPRSMVLGATAPAELGLSWGLSDDVPADVAAWLAATFALDRQEERKVVSHVLDELTAAVEDSTVEDRADEDSARARVTALVRFLAQTLDASASEPERLEERVRRLKVRARLRVPTEGGGFEKPRFGWVPTEETYAEVRAFLREVPRRIDPTGLDEPSRALLAACGAKTDLTDDEVDALLRGEGRLEGTDAACALASYVTRRALAEPRLIDAWKLHTRAFVPDRAGRLRPARELFWPDNVAFALLGADAPDFPDDEVVAEQPEDAGKRLGFATVEALSLRQIAERLGGREATPVLLDWLERGIEEGRLDTQKVGEALADRMRVRDDEGVLRPVSAVARSGARALFGDALGDFSFARTVPRLARALKIPSEPDARMVTDLLVEMSHGLEERTRAERVALERGLPEIYDRIADWARDGREVRLPKEAAVLATRGSATVLTRIGDPALCRLSPSALADALSADDRDALLAPFSDDPTLDGVFFAAGVPDLFARVRTISVDAGPGVKERQGEADRLLAALAPALSSLANRASVSDGLVAVFELHGGRGDGGVYRSPGAGRIGPVSVAAALHGSVLYLTAAALDDPRLLAPVLAPEPERRAAMTEWLARGELRRLPKRLARGSSAPETSPRSGFMTRLRDLFSSRKPAPSPERKARETEPVSTASSDERYFRERKEIRAQLDHAGGFSERRAQRPEYGFTFAPPTLASPWLYAPETISVRFERRSQTWSPSGLVRPASVGDVGSVVLAGVLPKGESILPLPLYGRVAEHSSSAESRLQPRRSGACAIRLSNRAEIELTVTLGAAPDAENALIARSDEAQASLSSFVPDDELPDEALDFVADLSSEPSPLARAFAVRDFIRRRYRYDPAYLEDPAVGRWLSRIARSRAHTHIAALHAGADRAHLGAGVCYELGSLACELMRRAGVPAAIATGWLYLDGALSEPDHLWALALLEDARGAPILVPIDAASTESGRPLRVPHRPPVERRPRKTKGAKAPRAPSWSDPRRPAGGGGGRGSPSGDAKKERVKKQRKVPRAELRRLLHYLATVTDAELTAEQRATLEKALEQPGSAKKLLARLLS